MQVFVFVCVCMCVCTQSQVGADRPAGKQAGWSLISPVGADTSAPAGLLQRKHVLYVMLEDLLFSLLFRLLFLFSSSLVCLSHALGVIRLFLSPLPGALG